jgi:hypothetical protein
MKSLPYLALLRIFSNLNFQESVWLLTTPASSLLSMLTAIVYNTSEEAVLTPVRGSSLMFLEAKLAVGLARITTLTACFTMIAYL